MKKYFGILFLGAIFFNYNCATMRCNEWRTSNVGLEKTLCDYEGRIIGWEYKDDIYGHYFMLADRVSDSISLPIKAEDMRDVNGNGYYDVEDAMKILEELNVNKDNYIDYLGGKGKFQK